MGKEINFDDVEFGEPIEKKEPNYCDGYIRGIYRAKNIIDSKQKEIERLNNIINEFEKYIKESCWKDDWGVESIYVETLLNKLQELKGSDKE